MNIIIGLVIVSVFVLLGFHILQLNKKGLIYKFILYFMFIIPKNENNNTILVHQIKYPVTH